MLIAKDYLTEKEAEAATCSRQTLSALEAELEFFENALDREAKEETSTESEKNR